ncbi:MAG: diacylglycerol kinase family lipid kinase [Clostridiales bacterium]|nr:diacylglycerol kinase family lipid kinase [Clostridiales bacterium]
MIHIIVNPSAGKGKALSAAKKTAEILTAKNMKCEVHETKRPMHAKEIAESCVKNSETSAIYCVGGDGTVHEVVWGMAGSDVPFALIPAGSGNDFALSLKNYKNKDTQKLVESFILGNTEKIDVIRCKTGNEVYYCANIASFGLDAEIVENAEKYKEKLGKFAYLASTLSSILRYEKKKLKITANGTEIDGFITLTAICNGKVYGGGFNISPSAKINDGKITLCVIKEMKKAAMSVLFPSVLFGLHKYIGAVSFTDCERVKAEFNGNLQLNIDGNIYPAKDSAEFEIVRNALTVLV